MGGRRPTGTIVDLAGSFDVVTGVMRLIAALVVVAAGLLPAATSAQATSGPDIPFDISDGFLPSQAVVVASRTSPGALVWIHGSRLAVDAPTARQVVGGRWQAGVALPVATHAFAHQTSYIRSRFEGPITSAVFGGPVPDGIHPAQLLHHQ